MPVTLSGACYTPPSLTRAAVTTPARRVSTQVKTGSVADTLPEGLTPRKLVRGASRGADEAAVGVQRADSDGRASAGKATPPPADALPGADLPPVLAPSRCARE